ARQRRREWRAASSRGSLRKRDDVDLALGSQARQQRLPWCDRATLDTAHGAAAHRHMESARGTQVGEGVEQGLPWQQLHLESQPADHEIRALHGNHPRVVEGLLGLDAVLDLEQLAFRFYSRDRVDPVQTALLADHALALHALIEDEALADVAFL